MVGWHARHGTYILGVMPIEFLHGRPLQADELELIRQQLEAGVDDITEVDPELRGIVERNWPHLLAKLPPADDT